MSTTATAVLPPRVTKAEVCRRLNVTIEAVDRLIRNGDLKCINRIGGVQAVVLESSLDDLINRMMLGVEQQQAG